MIKILKYLLFFLPVGVLFGNLSVQAQYIDTTAQGYTRYYYPNGRVSSEGILESGKANGYWISYYPDGIKKSEGNRINFELDGLWLFYDEDGDTLEKIHYHRGLKNGYHESFRYQRTKDGKKTGGLVSKELYYKGVKEHKSFYYRNGALYLELNYRNNKKNGLGKEYNPEGRIIALYQYRNDVLISKRFVNKLDGKGQKQGVWITFWPNDRIKTEAEYKDGVLNGFYKEYDIRGQLIKNQRYSMGKLMEENLAERINVRVRERYNDNGALVYYGGYVDTIPVGEHLKMDQETQRYETNIYDEHGHLISKGFKDTNRKRTGHWLIYNEDGILEAEGDYRNGKKHGKWTFYFLDGSIEQSGFYSNGKLDGEWKWFFDDGTVRRIEHYYRGLEDGEFVEYDRKGDEIVKGQYDEGLKTGDWIEQINGHLAKGKYVDGLKDGPWFYYYSNGNVKFEANFYQGQLDRKQKVYYENGKLKEEQFYVFGSREKKWMIYNPDGTLFMSIRYRNNNEYKINGKRIL